tara:strand:+ start:98 stop:508 length:411 start_codon:yes stop_codon:yes gene_type:complete
MKIYFAGSIRGGRDDVSLYHQIINYLKKYGEVLTEHVGSDSLTSKGENILNDVQIHDRDIKWLKSSDIIIAEVTNPSLGVGYEIAMALNLNKKIICLYKTQKGKRLSAMISGSKEINIIEYDSLEEVKNRIDDILT